MSIKSKYALTEAQVETLAHDRMIAATGIEQADGTYLKALVTAVQAVLGAKRGKRPATADQLAALDGAAEPFYKAVLRGVTTEDIAVEGMALSVEELQRRQRERNRRATFARTAKSTLATWVNEGGDLRAIDVATVTKTELRASIQAARAEGTEPLGRIERAQAAILRAVSREGPADARTHLEAVIEALQAALDDLPEPEAHAESTVIRTRVGAPIVSQRERAMLHKGA